MPRNQRLDVAYFPYEGETFDAFEKLDGKGFNAILLSDHPSNPFKIAEKMKGIQKLGIPVIERVGDPHTEIDRNNLCDFWPTYCWGFCPPSYFYKFFPSHLKYKMIVHGLELSHYQNLIQFRQRIKNRILNSGVAAPVGLKYRLRQLVTRNDNHLQTKYSGWRHYRLRSLCNMLSYVDYTSPHEHEYIGDRYPELLMKYRASIAATTTFPTAKYWEIPAAGCLTFMEITEQNDGKVLGHVDGETAIFIDEQNYKDKFEDYLSDPDNPKWERIANAGREYTIRNFNNDKAIEHLVALVEQCVME